MAQAPLQFYILMPVYNVETYIEQSIRSVLAQTYGNFRLIMVNDGSPDQSGDICDALATTDERLTVIHQENTGQIAARMTGIQEACKRITDRENSYFLFLDSDDWLEPNALEVIATHLTRTQCDCLVYGYQRVRNGRIVFRTDREAINEPMSMKEACRKLCLNSNYNSLCRKAIRCTAMPLLDYSAYYHLRLGEDLLQSLDILKRTKTVAFITDHLYNYRMNTDSVTESINYDKFDFDYLVEQKLLCFLRENNIHTEKTWVLQWQGLASRLYADVIKLLFSDHPWRKKQQWLRKIRTSTYVNDELIHRIPYGRFPRNQRVVLWCFAKQCYAILVVYYQISRRLNKS